MSTQKSWIQYPEDCEFPIENLPYGVFHLEGETPCQARGATKIGSFVVDLAVLEKAGLFASAGLPEQCFTVASLNTFMGAGKKVWSAVRQTLISLLNGSNAALEKNEELKKSALVPESSAVLLLPARIGDYTDFYSSREHATNLGKMFRPNDAPLLPNWLWLPVGYHGRASSVVVSGTDVRRPRGQTKAKDAAEPVYSTCKRLDYELEMAFFVGPGNKLGDSIDMKEADDHIFGLTVMNDWSARDVQSWEYVPLGPFTAKNFATTVSPWIVTLEALEPFRVPGPVQDPAVLSYLKDPNTLPGSYDIHLEVQLQNEALATPHTLSRGNFKYMYWSMRQQLVHHTVTGCNLNPGDLLGSGTISGPDPDSYGSLIELSVNGTKPIALNNGASRTFIEDGDSIALIGYCQGSGFRIGFGPCVGKILPAHPIQ
jgi:fumarylacetoacetase